MTPEPARRVCMQAAARLERGEQLAVEVQGLQAANAALQQALTHAQAKAGGPHLEAQAQRLAQELLLVQGTDSPFVGTWMARHGPAVKSWKGLQAPGKL